MRIEAFGFIFELKRVIKLSKQEIPKGSMMVVSGGCKIAIAEGIVLLTDAKGYILPNQKDLTLYAPLNGPPIATVQFNLGGIEPNPKYR